MSRGHAPADTGALRRAALDDPATPEPLRRALSSGGAFQPITLRADGTWDFDGRPVEHERVRALFYRSVTRTALGNWMLVVPPYAYPLAVEGAGWFVARLDASGAGGTLRGGEEVALAWACARTDGATQLFVDTADGRTARLVDAAYKDALDRIDQVDGAWVIVWPWGTVRLQPADSAPR